MKRICFLLMTMCACACLAFGQSAQRARIDKIKTSSGYKWGEATGDTKDEAGNKAMANLASKIKTVATTNNKSTTTYDSAGGSEQMAEQTVISSVASLSNLNEIYFCEDGVHTVFCYISNKDFQQAIDNRHESEKDLINVAMEQEKNLNIAGALKYYNWALTMISYFKDSDLKITVGNEEKPAELWLRPKIESVLSNLKFTLNEGRIEESTDPADYDKYTVILTATYAGNPVSNLDVSYFNGESSVTAHAKSGEIAMKFPDLASLPSIDMRVLYAYASEAVKVGNNELSTAYGHGPKFTDEAQLSAVSIPVRYKKGELKREKQGKKADSGITTASMPQPIMQAPRATKERNYKADASDMIAAMQQVETALRNRQYGSVRSLFTPEGFSLFSLMTKKGKVSVAKSPDYTVEESNLFTIGKGIPVTVANGKHLSKETIVFRFEKNSGLIKSVAYALTQRAENDIFRNGASWSDDSRYSLLTFMEDYQTAFALQRLDYIGSIFSDNAIIITGKYVDTTTGPKFHEGLEIAGKPQKSVIYKTQTKDEYITSLKSVFKNNLWTHIEFEDNEISKANTGGMLDHEVIWIEIRQNWTSASGYNDTGYLGLQINIKPSGSQINVRTWTPDFIDLNELKKRFPTHVELN